MKHSICLLFLLLLVGFEACRKEEEPYKVQGNGLVNNPVSMAYIKTMVIDSATGLPVLNASFYITNRPHFNTDYMYHFFGSTVDTTVINNWYTGTIGWGGDPRMPWGQRPADSTDIYFDASLDSLYGYVKIKAWELRVNDTIRLPDIYIAP
jgi:hypothetical protein